MKTVVFGGAFDPPHLEHSRLTKFACDFLGAERLVIVPTQQPPHKSCGTLSFEHRVALSKIAFEGCAKEVIIDEIELERVNDGHKYNYSSEVLPVLKAKYGEIVYLIGGDSLEYFHTWHKPEDIVKICPIAVVGRTGYDDINEKIAHLTKSFGGEFIPLDFNGEDVASSSVKAKLLLQLKPDGIADDVYDYIKNNHLFDKYIPWLEKLKEFESAPLYNHTENVVLRAVYLNSLHNLKQDFDKVFQSALLHDNAKERPSLDGLNVPDDAVGTSVLHQFLGAEKAKRDSQPAPAPVAAQAPVAPEASFNEEGISDNLTSVLEQVKAESEASYAEEPVAEPEVVVNRPETIVNSIPSRHSSQDTYKSYDNLFANIRKRTK